MRRFGQHAKLKPEKREEYIALHAATWEGVLKTIHKCNIQNYSIFIRGNSLFSYFEYIGDDYEADTAKMADDSITQEWWSKTKPCFMHHEISEYYSDMDQIFYTE